MTVDAVGDDEPIVVTTHCYRVRLNQVLGNTPFTIRAPSLSDAAITYAPGQTAILEARFYDGQTIGYIAVDTGSATFQVMCEGDW